MTLFESIKQGLVLDGAMSDELQRQGTNLHSDLWTASALIDQIDKVYQAHLNYFKAGANIVITDTYQANIPAFLANGYSKEQASNFIRDAVKVAKKARNDYEKQTGIHNFVAGTIGPYGAYLADGNEYRGEYELSKKEYLDFHLPRLKLILNEKPDIIAIETQPKLVETKVLLDWLKENAPDIPIYVSFTLRDSKTLSDGTPLAKAGQLVNQCQQVIGVGINCIAPTLVGDALDELHRNTKKALVVYPNQGASYNPEIKEWEEIPAKVNFSILTKTWYEKGARLIGGCCTTGPKEIEQISTTLKKLKEGR
ncbi:homocysteine S-methyltransferase [Lactobacillus sp.]|uniref:homocysteine S-methyltransferase n=1 Tax=Lactobacillus sp. TaxID=1591 RepID=UPI0019BCA9CB|nr:homocysteine S-methyltransferase [Lactobacillus sp.]MBD5429138.1 homocysteine S-methyltransferase [Lactobacillus sp.]